jgi:mannose-6-phosphate isomerase
MQVINGALKNYEWGILGGLTPWLTHTGGAQAQEPQAELWFGVHPSGASRIVDSDLTLDQVLDRNEVPVLVKILAAAKPLSVQVHPYSEFAREGYTELNNTKQFAGAFADPYEKIELLYALTPFTAFCGWRPLEQALAIFAALSLELPEGFSPNASNARRELFEYFVSHKFSLDTLDAIAQAVRSVGLPASEIAAYATVAAEYPGDQGALLAVFLQPISLSPGESIYIPAGMPHSYISGTGIEVMTSSDNVLRLGLTPKPIYAELALRALDFEASLPPVTDAPFVVEVIGAQSQPLVQTDLPTGQFRLVLCLDGTARIVDTTLVPGQAALLTADEPTVGMAAAGRCAIIRTRNIEPRFMSTDS